MECNKNFTIVYSYVYNLTDHLGNVRVSYAWDDVNNKLKTVNEDHYYPFGLQHKGYNKPPKDITGGIGEVEIGVGIGSSGSSNYKYKYNGKELQTDLDINLYDYGARNYDPAIGRFFNIDPMVDERTSVSPFNYVQNNPISKVDPTGMLDGWIDYEENGQRNVEYRSDINTKAEAEAAGYKNVSKVIESGTLTASNGTVYNLSTTGGVSLDNVLGTINYNTTQDVITSRGSHIKGFLNGYDGPGAISSPSFSYFDRWDHQVAMGTLQGGSMEMTGAAIGKTLSYGGDLYHNYKVSQNALKAFSGTEKAWSTGDIYLFKF